LSEVTSEAEKFMVQICAVAMHGLATLETTAKKSQQQLLIMSAGVNNYLTRIT